MPRIVGEDIAVTNYPGEIAKKVAAVIKEGTVRIFLEKILILVK